MRNFRSHPERNEKKSKTKCPLAESVQDVEDPGLAIGAMRTQKIRWGNRLFGNGRDVPESSQLEWLSLSDGLTKVAPR